MLGLKVMTIGVAVGVGVGGMGVFVAVGMGVGGIGVFVAVGVGVGGIGVLVAVAVGVGDGGTGVLVAVGVGVGGMGVFVAVAVGVRVAVGGTVVGLGRTKVGIAVAAGTMVVEVGNAGVAAGSSSVRPTSLAAARDWSLPLISSLITGLTSTFLGPAITTDLSASKSRVKSGVLPASSVKPPTIFILPLGTLAVKTMPPWTVTSTLSIFRRTWS